MSAVIGTFNNWNVVTLPLTHQEMVDWTSTDIVASSTSPWTGQMQTYDWAQSILSATVTLTKMSWADGQKWIAALQSCRGPLNVFQFGDQTQPSTSALADVNLVPDPYFSEPLGVNWTAPDPNWYIDPTTESLRVSATDSGSSTVTVSTSHPITVLAGAPYVLSGWLDATTVTSGWVKLQCSNAGLTTYYDGIEVQDGAKGHFSVAFYMPSGVTTCVVSLQVYDAVFTGSVGFSDISLTLGAPTVNGAGQTGYSLVTQGWGSNVAAVVLNTGDYISVTSAPVNSGDISIQRLHRVTSTVTCDSSGNATIPIYPPLRESPANGATISGTNTQGLFRLSQTQQKWNVSADHTTSLSFNIVEAL